METIRIGLIGDNIAASRAPDLHHAAARICGIDVKYERLVPRDLGLKFDDVVERAKQVVSTSRIPTRNERSAS